MLHLSLKQFINLTLTAILTAGVLFSCPQGGGGGGGKSVKQTLRNDHARNPKAFKKKWGLPD